ncbi:unnamed protein product, partial [Rotaria magnacalcarata]
MAFQTKSNKPIAEPLHFHTVHGDQIRLSDNNSRATRDRLNNTLLFTNRPILANEIVELYIEELSTEFYGLIRIGLTTIDPGSFTQQTLPKTMPASDNRDWFVPSPRSPPNIMKNKTIYLKYTTEGDILIDYDGTGFIKYLTVPPITKDIWCALDLNGVVAQIRLTQSEVNVLANSVDRARARYLQYTNNRKKENASIYYSGELAPGFVTMSDCDENSEISENIAVKKKSTAAIVINEMLKRSMCIVLQIIDMDHTLSTYLTIRCLTEGRTSNEHTKLIDNTFDYVTLGDEIGLRVLPDGCITFSCDNRHVKPLFNIDLTVNDNPAVQQTSYNLEFIMNGRVTGLRLVGIYRPTEAEARTLPPAIGGGCQATVIHRICPYGLSGLLLPCKHLCVCYECGKALIDRHSCPNIKCHVAYDAVPDQCNWNDTGIKLFENNENLYDPFNSSIELVHQPHTSSRLNQSSSTTISDRSANRTTDNSRNSSFEVLTNVISNFVTRSFSSLSKKRKFIIERPHGESLTSMDAIYKINQKEKTRNPPRLLQRKQQKPGKRQRNGITFMKVLQDGPKTLTKPTFETFDAEEASNDTNANVMSMISCHSNVPYRPSPMPYSTQIHAPYGYNQSLKGFYSYAQPPITCHRCNP